jgi:tetratricopeptide (TPR) repeat protein
MEAGWEARIEGFWAEFDDTRPEAMLEQMRALLSERPANEPEALYEWASVHDALELEQAAVPLYREALELGLDGPRRPMAVIQLASSLRNVGEPQAAVQLLEDLPADTATGDAAKAFLALALWDCGRGDQALRTALLALAPTLPQYRRAIEAYAAELQPTSAAPDRL